MPYGDRFRKHRRLMSQILNSQAIHVFQELQINSANSLLKDLLTHPEKDSFTWAIAGRSKAKVNKLAEELSVPSSVERLIVDNNDASDVERAVKNFKVVINLVGPYWKWGGSNVVKQVHLY